jgi:Flp pilus assembly protein TadG
MITRILSNKKLIAGLHGEEGSALVELTLSLPFLCIMLLGAAEFARLAYASIEVTNAAHSAAVYAASGTSELGDTPGIKNAAGTDSPNLVGTSKLTVDDPTISCQCSDGTGISCDDNKTCFESHTGLIRTVTVTTQSTFSPMVSLPGWKPTFTLQGKSSQVVSN